eukprot:jgi/Botrbrau1/15547/Bobra.0273s0001.1
MALFHKDPQAAALPYAPPVITKGAPPPPPAPAPSPADLEAAHAARREQWRQRRGFVLRVLAVVFVQLLFTTGMGILFFFLTPLKAYVQAQRWVMGTAFGIAAFTALGIAFSPPLRTKAPWNGVALLVFTLSFGFLVGAISSYANVQAAFLATAITCGVTASMFCGGGNVLGGPIPLGVPAGRGHLGGRHGPPVHRMGAFAARTCQFGMRWIAGLAGVLFSLWLMYDLQALMGTGPLARFRKSAIEPEAWVAGALAIYLDIGLILPPSLA